MSIRPDVAARIQRAVEAAEDHISKLDDALADDSVTEVPYDLIITREPYCGCNVCERREHTAKLLLELSAEGLLVTG